MKTLTQLIVCLLLLGPASDLFAQSVAVKSVYITGGGWVRDATADPSSTEYNPFTHVSGDPVDNHPVNDDLIMGSFQGSASFDSNNQAVREAGIAGGFFGSFGQIAVYTNPDNLYDPDNPSYGIYSPPTGALDTETGAVAMNLESWTMGWNGVEMSLGAGNVTATATPGGANGGWDLVLNWTSLPLDGGIWNGSRFHWRIEGEAFLVPEPGSLLLVGSGLAGLVGMARGRR